MEWEEPTVNGIWQKNEAGRRRISSAMILGATCAEGVYPDVRRFSVNFMPADLHFSERYLRMDEIIGMREGGRHGYCL